MRSRHSHHHNNMSKSSPVMVDHCCSCNNCNNLNITNNEYMCECTSCRNLGNSIDICCQCCSCSASADQYSSHGPRYHVASMAMQEDTLEVCLQQQTSADNHMDDIAMAHTLAERCHDCCQGHRFQGQRSRVVKGEKAWIRRP